MLENKELTMGVIPSGDSTSLLCEILDHQGIIYDLVSKESTKTYPVMILPEYDESALSIAKRSDVAENNVIICDKLVDIGRIRQFLSGETSTRDDQLDLFVNREEVKLVSEIRNQLANAGLPLVRKCFWPRRLGACCVITHDIDWFTYSPFHKVVLGGDLKIRQLIKLFLTNLLGRKNYGWNIPEMVSLEKDSGCKSTFLFQTMYPEAAEEYFAKSLEILKRQQDFEIALHASHSSHKDSRALDSELSSFHRNVGRDTEGIRYHILKFETPRTWKLEAEKNLKYDATFSYNEYFGFRAEVCFPYHPYADRERLPIVELPTGFMDWTLLHRKRRGRSAESILKSVKERVEEYNGVLTLNFHNTYINNDTFPDIYGLYRSIMKEVASESYWIATASECVGWWNERAYAKPRPIISTDGEIRAQRTAVELDVSGEKKFLLKYE